MPESGVRSVISTGTFQRALTASVDSCAEIKSAPSVAQLNLAEFGGRCRKAVLGRSVARSVRWPQTPSSEGSGKRCSECHSEVAPNSKHWFTSFVEEGAGKRCSECEAPVQTPRLQALVYDILPSATAVFSYAIGSRKLSANEQFFSVGCWCSSSSKFVTNISNKTRRVNKAANKVYTSTNKSTIV